MDKAAWICGGYGEGPELGLREIKVGSKRWSQQEKPVKWRGGGHKD